MPSVSEWGKFDLVKAAIGETRLKLACVSNVAETPLGYGVEGTGVPGITTYDGRVLCALNGDCYLFVNREFIEGIRETRDHLAKIGILSADDKPMLVPMDMDGKMHLPALLDMLKAEEPNEVNRDVPWEKIGDFHTFYWSSAANAVVSNLRNGERNAPLLRDYPEDRGERVLELCNKVDMVRAMKKYGVETTRYRFGYSKSDLLVAYDDLTEELGTNRVVLKYGQAVSGLGNKVVRGFKDLVEELEQVSDEYLAQNGALIEEFVEFLYSPGVVFSVDDEGEVEILSVSDQITDDGVHLGNVFPTQSLTDDFPHLIDHMYKGARAYAAEAKERGVTNIIMGLDFLVAPGADGHMRALASDFNGRYTGSSHMGPALRRVLKTDQPFAQNIGCVTDNNLKVPSGTTLDDLEEVLTRHHIDLPGFTEDQKRSTVVVPLNYAPAHYGYEKAQVMIVRKFDPEMSVRERKAAMLTLRSELHTLVDHELR